jgi:hypothetical protein
VRARAGAGEGGSGAERALAGAAALFVAHVALVLHFTPPGLSSLPLPLSTSAFAVEGYRADRALRALAATGRLSTYDPLVLAGQSAGLVERLGTRVLVLGTAALAELGVSPVAAFDGLSLALHALVPLVGYGAARGFGHDRRGAAAVLGVFSALTFVDALTHYAWFSGRIPFVCASAVVVLVAALAHRLRADWGMPAAVALVLAAAAAALLHPFVAVYGVAALFVAVAFDRERPLTRFVPVALGALPLVPLLFGPAAALSSEPLGKAFTIGPSSLFWDLVEIPGPGYGAAGASRTLLRTLCLGAGVVGLARLARARDPRAPLLAAFVALGLAVAYFGALVPGAWPVDPYYFAIPATFAAALPAVEAIRRVPWIALARRGPVAVRAALLVAAVVVTARAVRTVLTYAPELLPARVFHGPEDVTVSALGGINEPFPDPLGYDPPDLGLSEVAELLGALDVEGARVVVDDPALAAFLVYRTSFAVLGPVGERGGLTAAADPTSLVEGDADPARVHAFLDRYGVGVVVASGPPGPFDVQDPRFEPARPLHGYRVRRVTHPTSLVAGGTARVVGTDAHAIHVTGASGPRVTLRYHYDESLACRPACRIERVPLPGDAAGFVSIPDPPAAFDIYAP